MPGRMLPRCWRRWVATRRRWRQPIKGLAIFPDSPFLHWPRANLLFAEGHLDEAEQEYKHAIAIHSDYVTW